MTKVLFFTGVPINDAATLYRSGLVAQKLLGLGYKVIFTSVAADFQKNEVKQVGNLPVLFIGQAHYFTKRSFFNRKRFGFLKTITKNLKTCVGMSTILKQEKPDKVLVVTSMPVSLMVGLLSKILGFKTFIDIEDLAIGQMEAAGYPKFLVWIYSIIEKLCLKGFDKIIVPSSYLQKKYRGSFLLPNMVDISFWKSKKRRRAKKRIIFVGQIGLYHGQMEVLNSFVPTLRANKDYQLVFVGGGEKENNLKLKIENLKLKEQVIMIGQVSQDKVRELLASCDVGVLPLWDTPVHQARHPLKLLEYLAAGLVIVTNSVGEAEKIVKNGVNGILCPPGDIDCLVEASIKIFNDSLLTRRLSQKAALSAKEFSTEKILPRWIEVLNS